MTYDEIVAQLPRAKLKPDCSYLEFRISTIVTANRDDSASQILYIFQGAQVRAAPTIVVVWFVPNQWRLLLQRY